MKPTDEMVDALQRIRTCIVLGTPGDLSAALLLADAALEAALSRRPEGVTISKALEWRTLKGSWMADTPVGNYRINLHYSGKKRIYYLWLPEGSDVVWKARNLDEAKAAAQSDFTSRSQPSDREGWRTRAADDVFAERRRQVEGEGWTAEHDDAHAHGEIADAAALYASLQVRHVTGFAIWPWSSEWWKPSDRRRELVKAGALILAEIERLDRIPTPTATTMGEAE